MSKGWPISQEQRLTFRLLSYWNRIRGTRELPSLSDVNISEITEMWHLTFTIDVSGGEEDHKFQYFGPDLATIFGTDYTGQYLADAMNDTTVNNTLGFYPKVMEDGKPHSESSSFYLEGKEVRYRSLIVPLSSDGETIDFVLGTTNYKIFD